MMPHFNQQRRKSKPLEPVLSEAKATSEFVEIAQVLKHALHIINCKRNGDIKIKHSYSCRGVNILVLASFESQPQVNTINFLQDALLQLRFSPTEEDEPSIYDMRPAPPPQGNKLDGMGGWSSPPNHDSHLPHIDSMADLPDMYGFFTIILIVCTCQKVIICNTHVHKFYYNYLKNVKRIPKSEEHI